MLKTWTTLFKICVNDFISGLDIHCDPVHLNETPLSCLFYADDLVLLSSSKEGLQTCLNKLSDFCHKWKLLVNFNKTKCMLFNTQGRLIQHKFNTDEHIIENVRNYCYFETDHLTCKGGVGGYGFFYSFRIFFSQNTRVRIFISRM